MKKQVKQRDVTIQKAFKNEIDLKTKSIPSKKSYSRKEKHKNKEIT